RQISGTDLSKLEARIKELQGAQLAAEQKAASLTDSLAPETKRRESAEQQAAEIGKHRSQLEAELVQNKQAQTELRQELERVQKELESQEESSGTEQIRLEAEIRELQAAKSEAEQQVRKLTESLAQESIRRESAEALAGEIEKRRSKLETQLTQLSQE